MNHPGSMNSDLKCTARASMGLQKFKGEFFPPLSPGPEIGNFSPYLLCTAKFISCLILILTLTVHVAHREGSKLYGVQSLIRFPTLETS